MELTQATIIPVVLALTEVAKKLGLRTKWCPVLAIILGAVGSVYLNTVDLSSILSGIVYGLSASGLYSGTKSVIE